MTNVNLASDYLKRFGLMIESFEGLCGELCDELLHEHPDAKILYIGPVDPDDHFVMHGADGQIYYWMYHMVPVIDGVVHDAWFPEMLLPPDQYVAIFKECQWEIYG
jgi:hypothetical protein